MNCQYCGSKFVESDTGDCENCGAAKPQDEIEIVEGENEALEATENRYLKAVYCEVCGSELDVSTELEGFDAKTGKQTLHYYGVCPRENLIGKLIRAGGAHTKAHGSVGRDGPYWYDITTGASEWNMS